MNPRKLSQRQMYDTRTGKEARAIVERLPAEFPFAAKIGAASTIILTEYAACSVSMQRQLLGAVAWRLMDLEGL